MKIAIMLLIFCCFAIISSADEVIQYGLFGDVHLYQKSATPSQTVIFVSGDGGWNQGVIGMAQQISSTGALVAGVDIVHYLRALKRASNRCSYPAADFEALSKYLQKRVGASTYKLPVLMGYSSGATLVYAVLSQAPPNTFLGGISLGFCPDLRLGKSFCQGDGLKWSPRIRPNLYVFLPDPGLNSKWITIQGEIDKVCNCDNTAKFVSQIKNASIVRLPRVGHGFSASRNWLPQVLNAYQQLLRIQENSYLAKTLTDLPLVEVKSSGTPKDAFAVILTGDGGWASLDRSLGIELSKHGIPVVGFNSLQYFWKARTPQQAGNDLNRIIQTYLQLWAKRNVILIGYSFGADVLPFMINRLQPTVRKTIAEIALLGPSEKASFEFHITDWLGITSKSGAAVAQEIAKLQPSKALCVAGDEEKDSVCKEISSKIVTLMELHGGHHFGGAYHQIAERIIQDNLPHLQGTSAKEGL
ncbi:MAG TPA: AcvB/VirJ family lysyl-phosphatidylglycerol hydrolase [Acidobacteriota bacterium]|nr:AcvB/VirJ family lysyl-phosphatidylglycerol hydrolase [Acidobacteriota bacterium]